VFSVNARSARPNRSWVVLFEMLAPPVAG